MTGRRASRHTSHTRIFYFHPSLARNKCYQGKVSFGQTSIEAPKVRDGNLAIPLSAWPKISSTSIVTGRLGAYSGNDIFCRFVKKSLLRIVEADSILPERLVTIWVTSSGSAMPSAKSTRFSGFKVSIPSASSSFSNVLITKGTSQTQEIPGTRARFLPGRLFTKASKVWYVCRVSGSVDCKYAWKTMSSKYRRRFWRPSEAISGNVCLRIRIKQTFLGKRSLLTFIFDLFRTNAGLLDRVT